MVEIAIILIINALFCAGLHIVTRYETTVIKYGLDKEHEMNDFDQSNSMALGYAGYVVEEFLPAFLHKPLLSCLTCMGSVYGSAFFFAYWMSIGCPERLIYAIGAPVYVIALAGLNTLIDRKLNEL